MKDLQAKVQIYLQDRKWDTVAPGDFAKSISIEAAELLEHFQWGHPSSEETMSDAQKMSAIQSEIADVMIYCLDLCVVLKLDASQIIDAKITHNSNKYPAHLMKSAEAEEAYMKIKKKYRTGANSK